MLIEQRYHIYTSDNLTILRTLPDNSVDAVVTDPPAGIGFMGKEWDKDKGGRDKWIDWMAEVAAECLRVIKPGGHALVWALPRTSHWTATAWENAGWEPRDRICHIFGSGFPKSANISKQIDRMAGAEREVVSEWRTGKSGTLGGKAALGGLNGAADVRVITAPATDAAKQWDGYGTALKPAVEDYWLFRKPIEKGLNIAQNVLKWGTGGLNVDGCRVGTEVTFRTSNAGTNGKGWGMGKSFNVNGSAAGRFPAHLIHDGSDEVEAVFPQSNGGAFPAKSNVPAGKHYEGGWKAVGNSVRINMGSGSASRFFYCTKPGKSERDAGCEELETHYGVRMMSGDADGSLLTGSGNPRNTSAKNIHPTVKALKLMTYLCRLITPPNGLILDPFTGSGSTGCAAMLEGFRFIGMEQSPEYAEIARRRIEHWRDVASQIETIIEDVQEKLFAEMI